MTSWLNPNDKLTPARHNRLILIYKAAERSDDGTVSIGAANYMNAPMEHALHMNGWIDLIMPPHRIWGRPMHYKITAKGCEAIGKPVLPAEKLGATPL